MNDRQSSYLVLYHVYINFIYPSGEIRLVNRFIWVDIIDFSVLTPWFHIFCPLFVINEPHDPINDRQSSYLVLYNVYINFIAYLVRYKLQNQLFTNIDCWNTQF